MSVVGRKMTMTLKWKGGGDSDTNRELKQRGRKRCKTVD